MDLLHQGWGMSDADVYGATVHRHIDWLPTVFPNARFIHLLRDPRDVARSVINMGWEGTAFYAAERWLKVELSWDKLKGNISKN